MENLWLAGVTVVSGLTLAAIYCLMALGLTMIYGVLRILHIAHGAVFTLGAYVGMFALLATGSFALSLPTAMLACGVAGWVIYRWIYRPMLEAPRYVPLIASIGLLIILDDLYRLLWGPEPYPFKVHFPWGAIKTAAFVLTPHQIVVTVVAAALLTLVWILLNKTDIGLAWRAAAEDLETAGTMGINLNRVIAVNFFVGSALAGAGGVLTSTYLGDLYPSMGFVPAYKAFVVIVLGGMGNVAGAVWASLLLGMAEQTTLATIGNILPRDSIGFLVMILFLLFRPTGLFGERN